MYTEYLHVYVSYDNHMHDMHDMIIQMMRSQKVYFFNDLWVMVVHSTFPKYATTV